MDEAEEGGLMEIAESTMTMESLELVVTACVESLESVVPPMEAKQVAAVKLRLLAKHRSNFPALIGVSGAIPALIPLLRSVDPTTDENAVNLSLEESNKIPITEVGAIKPLCPLDGDDGDETEHGVRAAEPGDGRGEPNDNRGMWGDPTAGVAAAPRVEQGEEGRAEDAVQVLLSEAEQGEGGAAGPLMGLLGERRGGTTEKEMVVLGCLAAIPKGRAVVVEAEGILAQVEAIEDGPA